MDGGRPNLYLEIVGLEHRACYHAIGPMARRHPAMDHEDPLTHVLKIILCEGWKLPANQQSEELDRCANILLKRIRAGDSYESLLSYVIQLRGTLGLRVSEPATENEIVERIIALARSVRED